jgi:hypothetical protein
MFILDPGSWLWIFYIPDSDPGVKKAPDPGSATLIIMTAIKGVWNFFLPQMDLRAVSS